MSVYRGVSRSSGERFVIAVWNMFSCLCIFVSLGQAIINHIACILSSRCAHEEIVWLHVSMDKIIHVKVFKTGDHLVSKHAYSLESKATATVLEEVL